MRYLFHPESVRDLQNAAKYYQERAGNALSLALFTEFEHSIQLCWSIRNSAHHGAMGSVVWS